MLSILVVSQNSEGFGLARRFANEGNIVKFWDSPRGVYPETKRLRVIDDYKAAAEAVDFIFLCSPGFGAFAATMGKAGRVVFGGGLFQDVIEEDPKLISRLMSLQEGVEEFRIKLCLLLVKGNLLADPLLGISYERLMDGDRGPYIGSAGECTLLLKDGRLLSHTYKTVESILREKAYSGFLTLTLGVGEGSLTLKEMTTSFDPAYYTIFERVRENIGESIYTSILDRPRFRVMEDKVSTGVRLSFPPFPYTSTSVVDLSSALDVNPEAEKHFWWSGPALTLGWVTGWGRDTNESRRRVYRTIETIVRKPEVQYRGDICWRKQNSDIIFNKLQEEGWIDAPYSRKIGESIREQPAGVNKHLQGKGKDRECETQESGQS